MCGITGIFDSRGIFAHHSAFLRANEIIAHRGPDGQGVAYFDSSGGLAVHLGHGRPSTEECLIPRATLAIGHRRLAIIDLTSAGDQPMCNEDGSIWIVFNGEIYNYLELRSQLERLGHHFKSNSDTEVILHAYESFGQDCVQSFVGMWAFALFDGEKNSLFCSRDRFGIKPFFYYWDGKVFAFGSEIKQLLTFPFVSKRPNQTKIYDFLVYSAVDYGEETFLEDIRKLLPGHNLTIDLPTGLLLIDRFYQPKLTQNTEITAQESADEFGRLFRESVRLHLRSDVEVGSCLSGGLDSSSIVCTVHDLLEREKKPHIQRSFSSHFEEEEANELRYIKAVVDHMGVDAHFTYPTPSELLEDINQLVWHQDEPFATTSIFAQWSVFKLIAKNSVKVMLDGQGADEILGGYIHLTNIFLHELWSKHKHARFMWEILRYAQFNPGRMKDLIKGTCLDILGLNTGKLSAESSCPCMQPDFRKKQPLVSPYLGLFQPKVFGGDDHFGNHLYHLTFDGNLQTLLRYEDRNSMAFSVESRVPFLDHRLVEFAFSLPSWLKIRNGYTKRCLRDAMKGVIPNMIRLRTSKLGFATPERTWQTTTLQPLFKKAAQSELLRPYIDHKKALDHAQKVINSRTVDSLTWRIINLYLWLKMISN